MEDRPDTVAVIGGGFSGALCALHLSAAQPHLRIRVIERGQRLGPGLAYGACIPEHLLNVPVSRLGIGLEPTFEAWLQESADPSVLREALEESGGVLGEAFVPRYLFGDYLEDLVKRRLEPEQVSWMRGEAVAFLDAPQRGILLADGREVEASSVVLALGNQTPAPPEGMVAKLRDEPEYVADPWIPGALSGIGPDDPVTIIGAGLTMVDVALMLRRQGHRAKVTAFSRRGLLPRVHAVGGRWPAFIPELLPASPATLVKEVRKQFRLAEAERVPWQRVIDSIRPYISQIWDGWSSVERQRFLRHLRVWWDVFRHRMPIRVSDAVQALVTSGDLEVMAGRLRGYERDRSELLLKVVRSRKREIVLRARHVINCSGPRTDFTVLSSPLVLDARRKRLIKADQLGLGIETAGCIVVNQDGHASDWLYAIGSLTRPARWEITAVPEINAQILSLAKSFISPGSRNVDDQRELGGEYYI